jgi:hypothetical protein
VACVIVDYGTRRRTFDWIVVIEGHHRNDARSAQVMV